MALALSSPVPALADRQSLGKQGEELACRELTRRGYAVLARRYRSRFGEIDIVCRQGRTIVFVEVRARRTARYGRAAESIVPRKRRRIAAMALDYLAWTGQVGAPCRFDVVAIDGLGTKRSTLQVFQNAFPAGR
jgi:putative endonuclease